MNSNASRYRPCAPSEPVPHSSGFVATSEHAVISGWSAGSFSPVQSIPRAVCVATHGFGGVESMTRATYISMLSKPVFFSSDLAVTNEHAVQAVISVFSAESSAVVQGKSCVDRAGSHGFDVAMSGGSCGRDTSLAHLARSQPGVGTQYALFGYPGVELVSRATYISRKKRNLETVQRQSKALKKAQRDAKRKFIAQLEISHDAADLILRNQAARTDEKILVPYTSATISPCYMSTRTCFSVHSVVPSMLVRCEATEVSVRRIWRIQSESETQA